MKARLSIAAALSVYGMSATLALGDTTSPRQVAKIHSAVLVLDSHADIEIPGKEDRFVGPDGRSRVAPDKLKAGGVDAIVLDVAVGPEAAREGLARKLADEKLASVLDMVRNPDNAMLLARTATEVRAAHRSGKIAVILGFQNADIIGKDVNGLDYFYAQGARVFALNHLGHNDYADSSRSEAGLHVPPRHFGLSELGRAALTRINDLGGLLDVTQLSKEATLQAVRLSRAPVIASHSNVRTLSEATRNLSDEEIDAIAAKGGVICVTPFVGYLYNSSDKELVSKIRAVRREAGLMEDFMYPYDLYWAITDLDKRKEFRDKMSVVLGPGTIESMVDHIDYLKKRVGIDHIGIGSDFNHGGGIENFAEASQAGNVTAALIKRGYKPEEIRKIWGGNFLRAMAQAEKARRR